MARTRPPVLTLKFSQGYTVTVIGDESSGKTALCNRFVKNEFNADTRPTIGGYFIRSKSPSKTVYWDTSGSPIYEGVACTYIRQAECVIVCMDSTRELSRSMLQQHFNNIKKNAKTGTRIIVAVTKQDDAKCRMSSDEVVTLCNQVATSVDIEPHTISIHLVSAKTGFGVKELLTDMIPNVNNPAQSVAAASSSSSAVIVKNAIDVIAPLKNYANGNAWRSHKTRAAVICMAVSQLIAKGELDAAQFILQTEKYWTTVENKDKHPLPTVEVERISQLLADFAKNENTYRLYLFNPSNKSDDKKNVEANNSEFHKALCDSEENLITYRSTR